MHDTVETRPVHKGPCFGTRDTDKLCPYMRHGLYRMAPSSNPMEASPLDLRSVTVIPRALLEAIRGDDDNTTTQQQQQQPSEHQQPPADIAPRVVR